MNKIHIALLSIILSALSATGFYLYQNSNKNQEIQATLIEYPEIQKLTPEQLEEIEDISMEDLHLEMTNAHSKLQSVLEYEMEHYDINGKLILQSEIVRLQGFFSGIKSFATQIFTRLVIPSFTLAQNVFSTLESIYHKVCKPQGLIENVLSRVLQYAYPPTLSVCEGYENLTGGIRKFVQIVSNLRYSRNEIQYQSISQRQADSRLLQNFENMNGSLNTRTECLQRVRSLRHYSKKVAQETSRIVDSYKCDPRYSGCKSMTSLNYNEFDSNWRLESQFNNLKSWSFQVAADTRFVEGCKAGRHFFQGDL